MSPPVRTDPPYVPIRHTRWAGSRRDGSVNAGAGLGAAGVGVRCEVASIAMTVPTRTTQAATVTISPVAARFRPGSGRPRGWPAGLGSGSGWPAGLGSGSGEAGGSGPLALLITAPARRTGGRPARER